MSAVALPDLNALPADALRALIMAQHEQLISRDREIEHLKLLLAKLHRMQFGRKSEKLERQIEQLELRLEELESKRSEQEPSASTPAPVTASSTPVTKPTRRALPDHLPRQTRRHEPKETVCLECQGELRKLGEDVSEMLEYVPASFVVIRHARTKLSCTKCDCIVQAEAPSRPIARGLAGPGLLAHVLVSKYCDHLPLYRQSEIYARRDVELERSTLADWVGGSAHLLQPLVEALRHYVMAAGKLHADDTPVLAPGQGKTKTGRLWTYVRDDRPAGDTASPAVWSAYSPDRNGEHPAQHLKTFRGTLQADAYAGFNQLYENGRIEQAACWAHVRRKFYDLEQAHASPVAREALMRIGTLYGIEEQIRGKPPNERRAVRQAQSKPLLDSLRQWFEATLSKLSRKSETTAAIRYALVRWDALTRYIEDGHIEIDNNAAERSLRGVALGRKNYLFAGSDAGGERAAAIYSLIGSAKLDGSLSARSAHPHRRSSNQPHRGTASMESRRQRPATSQRVKKKANAKAESFLAALSLPNIAQLIEDGEITIGMLRPVGCVATASDEDCNYAMLVRRRGESLFQLLTRLDQAIDKALTLDIFTDEING